MVDFRSFEDVEQWVDAHGYSALRELLQHEALRSNAQSLASVWLARQDRRVSPAATPEFERRRTPVALRLPPSRVAATF
jgi:hypothetical protein